MARKLFRKRSKKSKDESDNIDSEKPIKKSSIFRKKPKPKTSTEKATSSHHKRVNKKRSRPIDNKAGSTTSADSATIKTPKTTEPSIKKAVREPTKAPDPNTTVLKKPITLAKDSSKTLPPNERQIALAIVTKIKDEAQISSFIDYGLETLKKYSTRLNKLAQAYNLNKFCLIVGDGPKRYRVHKVLHPCTDAGCDEKLTIEVNDNEDLDVFGFAAVLKLDNDTILNLFNYLSKQFGLTDDEFQHEYTEGKKLGAQMKVLKEVNSKFCVLYKYEIEITAALSAQMAAKSQQDKKKMKLIKRIKN